MIYNFICVWVVLIVGCVGDIACRDKSKYLRLDGGLCFEIPPWQLAPVNLEEHLEQISGKYRRHDDIVDEKNHSEAFSKTLRRNVPTNRQKMLMNSEVTRYMDTVIGPFLDTYHRNIQNSYQQFTDKLMKRIKTEILDAAVKKNNIYSELSKLVEELNIPVMCNEERRDTRTLASAHIAYIHQCTEDARVTVSKMGHYAEEMIKITKKHIQKVLDDANAVLETRTAGRKEPDHTDIAVCLKDLSHASVTLGYDLDMSLTNAKRHAEQSCEKLTSCVTRVKKSTEEQVVKLKEKLNQCVYA